MKVIKYQMLTEVNYGTNENPNITQKFLETQITCADDKLEANEEIAKAEAYKGEYTVEDVGETYV